MTRSPSNGITWPDTLDHAVFFASYWQQTPLVIPEALTPASDWPEAKDVLDVAAEPDADSRLVIRDNDTFRVTEGPLQGLESMIRDSEVAWTVLVQAMEVWFPTLHSLFDVFSFLPRWRFDDLMISVSGHGGGVGAHVDQYDVFLLQIAGDRRWSWGGPVGAPVEGSPLRQVAGFSPIETRDFGPGDILYLPPGVVHDGVALNEGAMTLSIGFRSPGVTDLVAALADVVDERWLGDTESEPRYRDNGRQAASNPYELDDHDLGGMIALFQNALKDRDLLTRAIGGQVTLPRLGPDSLEFEVTREAIERCLTQGGWLERWSGSRLAYARADQSEAILFFDGVSAPVTLAFAQDIVERERIDHKTWSCWQGDGRDRTCLLAMIERGTFGLVIDSD